VAGPGVRLRAYYDRFVQRLVISTLNAADDAEIEGRKLIVRQWEIPR